MEEINYQFKVNKKLWREFTNTFPREVSIDRKLTEMIKEEVRK